MENNDTKLPCTIDELKAVLTTLAEGEFYYVDIGTDKNVLLTMSNLNTLFEYSNTVVRLLWTEGGPEGHGPYKVVLTVPATNEKTILLVSK